jgi:hypothetical protein
LPIQGKIRNFPHWNTEFDFIMREFTLVSFRGLLFFGLFTLVSAMGLNGQILKEISGAVKTATEPAKEAQGVIKAVGAPAKEANKAITTAERAPQTIEKSYDQVGNEADRTKKDYEKIVDKFDGNGKKADDKSADTTATTKTAEAGDGKAPVVEDPTRKSAIPADYVPATPAAPVVVTAPKKAIDPMDVPRPVPAGSRDNKTASGPLADSETSKAVATGGTETEAVVVPVAEAEITPKTNVSMTADTVPTAIASEEQPPRFVALKNMPRSGEKRPKPDYSHSPARIALEKADFEIETLEDLFRYSNWEGPEREHTVRSVAHSLDDLQQSIVEVKKLDPGQSTWRFEEAYKDMKAGYLAEMKRNQ